MDSFISLVECWVPLWNEYLVYFFAMAFLGWVPSLIISFVQE